MLERQDVTKIDKRKYTPVQCGLVVPFDGFFIVHDLISRNRSVPDISSTLQHKIGHCFAVWFAPSPHELDGPHNCHCSRVTLLYQGKKFILG